MILDIQINNKSLIRNINLKFKIIIFLKNNNIFQKEKFNKNNIYGSLHLL